MGDNEKGVLAVEELGLRGVPNVDLPGLCEDLRALGVVT